MCKISSIFLSFVLLYSYKIKNIKVYRVYCYGSLICCCQLSPPARTASNVSNLSVIVVILIFNGRPKETNLG